MLYNEVPTFTSVNETQVCDHSSESYLAVFLVIQWTKPIAEGLVTRREGYPSKWVNPSWRAKDSTQAKFHR